MCLFCEQGNFIVKSQSHKIKNCSLSMSSHKQSSTHQQIFIDFLCFYKRNRQCDNFIWFIHHRLGLSLSPFSSTIFLYKVPDLIFMVTRVSRNEICNIIKWNSWLPVKDINARIALCGYVIEWLNLLKVVILSRMVVLILKANFWLLRL